MIVSQPVFIKRSFKIPTTLPMFYKSMNPKKVLLCGASGRQKFKMAIE